MISNSLKTFVCSLLLFTLAQAQSSAESTANLSQFYSQLQGTYWSGTFEVSFKLAVGKANSDGKKKVLFHGKVAPHPIEISFLNQQGNGNISYTFFKDITDLKGEAKKGFELLDPVPCTMTDGTQEPRVITLAQDKSVPMVFKGKINLNDCKPKHKKPSKIPAELSIESLAMSDDQSSLVIEVKGAKGPGIIEIVYLLKRVNKSDLKLH